MTFEKPTGKAVGLFSEFVELYGTSWTREHGFQMSEKMAMFLDSISQLQYQRILAHCRDKLKTWSGAPTLGELITWSELPTRIELMQSFTRVMQGNHENDIERWLVSKWLYNLKRWPMDTLDKQYNKLYYQGIELEKLGKLFTHEESLLALPPCSVKNVNDLTREQYENKVVNHRHKAVLERIAGMIRSNTPKTQTSGS